MDLRAGVEVSKKIEKDSVLSSSSPFLSVDEAAALLDVDRKTLYEAIRHKQIPGVIRIGRAIRLRRSALLDSSPGNGGPALKESKR